MDRQAWVAIILCVIVTGGMAGLCGEAPTPRAGAGARLAEPCDSAGERRACAFADCRGARLDGVSPCRSECSA